MSDNANAIAAILTALALLVTAFGGILVPLLSRRNEQDNDDDEIRNRLLELLEERDQAKAVEISRLNALLNKGRRHSDDGSQAR